MRNIFSVSIFLLLICSAVSYSQIPPPPIVPGMMPGRTMDNPPLAESYADSAEFAKIFSEYYQTIKPAKSVKEDMEQYFQNMSRAFAMQGIDSAEAAKAAFANIDENAYEKIYFDTYRRNLSAQELKKYMEFIKTPEGKHISEILPNLQRPAMESMMYVQKTINMNLIPVRQAAREKFEKEHPPQKGAPGSPQMVQPALIIPGSIGIAPAPNAPASKETTAKKAAPAKKKK